MGKYKGEILLALIFLKYPYIFLSFTNFNKKTDIFVTFVYD